MTKRTKTIGYIVLAALAVGAIFLGLSWMTGCAAPAKPVPVPMPSVPQPTDPTPPPPDVGASECVSKIHQMQGAVSIAKIGAALLVAREPQYKAAVNIAISALDGALIAAEIQCYSGRADAWAIALAAFDKAFAELVVSGELSALAADEEIAPWEVSTEEWNARVFQPELAWGVEIIEGTGP